MNANQIANALDKLNLGKYSIEAAAMLRQQQAEIEVLRDRIAYLESQVHGGTTQ